MNDLLRRQRAWPCLAGALVGLAVVCAAPPAAALEKEVSLVTKEPIGALAVAGRLSIDLHADFMASRTYESDTVLNWYNCGYSGGGGEGGLVTKVGGTFGDFGFQVPWQERDDKYPHAARVDDVPGIRFDGGDTMTANFPIEPAMLVSGGMAIEVWFRTVKPSKGDVILGWQSPDGTQASAPLTIPKACTGSPAWRHLVVNRAAHKDTWYLDGEKVSGGAAMAVGAGHRMVLGGATATKPSFKGEVAAVRLHDQPMTEEEIAHNLEGGPMLGTEMHDWWRTEGDTWWSENSAHFRHAIDKAEMATWTEQEMQEFNERKPEMFRLAELAYRCYSERMALRTSVVSRRADERGDGIKYRTPIQPTDGGNYMGSDDRFGWSCQGPGHINPHELVHGYDVMTGNMAGNYWEAHANMPQTYIGIYQTIPFLMSESSAFPCTGRTYYHDRLMFEHLAQTPAYGPMFISKMWYDGPTRQNEAPYPWQTFERINPHPDRTLGDEYTLMAMRTVTADFTTFVEAFEAPGNTRFGNDGLVSEVNRYRQTWEENRTNAERTLLRSGRVRLQPIPHEAGWWRVPKEQAPQQLGWNVCPLACRPGKVTAELEGYADSIRGADWRAGFVGVTQDDKPVYGDVFGPGKPQSFTVTAAMKELCLVVCGTPSKVLDIPMTGDFRSFPQRQFPYRVRFSGCDPIEPLVPPELPEPGAAHVNGGGFVAATASVSPSAFVGPQARVLGTSQVRDQARIEDFATVLDASVQDDAIVSGHAFVHEQSTVRDNAKVRGYAVVGQQTTVSGNARILEHARLVTGKTCGGEVTVKGVAHVYGGSQSGSAMIDGFYAKANDITKGKWFTWSWGLGQNPGEIDEDFGGLYADYDFNQPHDSLALDAFGATWGYLVNGAAIEMRKDRDAGSKYQDDVYPALHFHDQPLGDTVVQRLVGHLRAPATGEYTFWISADDNAEFWIGQPKEDVAGTLACVATIGSHLEFTVSPHQKSAPVKLVAGTLYPIAVMHQQAEHAQHFAVAWTRPGRDAPEVIPGDVLSTDRTGGTPGLRRRIWRGPPSIDAVVDSADYRPEIRPEKLYDGAVRLNGRDQWVALPPDVADMPTFTCTVEVKWDGTSADARIFEFSNEAGDAMGLLPDHGGKLLFAMQKGKTVESVSGPALRKNQWTTVQVTIDGATATLSVDGDEVGRNESMTLCPDSIGATDCSLGRGRKGGFFGGCISHFQVHARVPEGTLLPVTFLSPWDKHELAEINRLFNAQRLPPQNVKGLVVTGVRPGAATTPLQPNDVLVQIGDVRLASGRKVAEALESLRGHSTVDVTVRRCTTPLNGQPSWSMLKLWIPTMSTTTARFPSRE